MKITKKCSSSVLFFCMVLCLIFVPNVQAFTPNDYSIPQDSVTDLSSNPYVEAYLQHESKQIQQFNNVDTLVDPEIRQQMNVQTLSDYYTKDVYVGEVLTKLSKDNKYNQKAISLEINERIDALHAIVESYNLADEEEQKQFKGYMDRYSINVNDEVSLKFLQTISPNKTMRSLSASGTYNGVQAANWAYNNYDKYNSNYPAFNNWGSDCANFVSQAMHEGGGMAFVGDWYVYKLNSTYPSPSSSKQLDYSWDLADPSPWISASEFSSHWRSEVPSFYYSNAKYHSDHEDIYYNDINLGDAVVFNSGWAGIFDLPEHVMIISSYDSSNKDFKLAGHSNMRQAYPLLDAIDNFSSITILRF